jgi:hypothetical protein
MVSRTNWNSTVSKAVAPTVTRYSMVTGADLPCCWRTTVRFMGAMVTGPVISAMVVVTVV